MRYAAIPVLGLVLALAPAPVTAQEPGIVYDPPVAPAGTGIAIDPSALAPLRSGATPIRRIEVPQSTAQDRLGSVQRHTGPVTPGVVRGLDGQTLSIGCFPAEACDDLYER